MASPTTTSTRNMTISFLRNILLVRFCFKGIDVHAFQSPLTDFVKSKYQHHHRVVAGADHHPQVTALSELSLSSRPKSHAISSLSLKASSEQRNKTTKKDFAPKSDVEELATNLGLSLSFGTLGPGYRATIRSPSVVVEDEEDEEESGILLGYCEGFIRPGGKILHLDKMEVYRTAIKRASQENPKFINGGNIFGVGMLVGYLCVLHGYENGCQIGEFLAIDDEDKQHRRLVKFYERAGFDVIRYVGDDMANIPDRLIWGGRGTLMNQDLETLLRRWSGILFREREDGV